MPVSKTYGVDAQIRREVRKAMQAFGAGDRDFLLVANDAFPATLYQAFERLGAKSDLLSIVGSWGDTMDPEWVLSALLEWNGRVRPISGRLPN
jgi:hypothetical protein